MVTCKAEKMLLTLKFYKLIFLRKAQIMGFCPIDRFDDRI